MGEERRVLTSLGEDGMLLPPLCSQKDYVNFAHGAGFKTFVEPMDISKQVLKTW